MAQVYREQGYIDHRLHSQDTPMNVAARIVYLISGIINGLLAIRFAFVLFGANSTSTVADFIYTTTQPLVAPFFGLFNYQAVYGQVRFEFETLVAILAYSLLSWIIVRALTVGRR